MSLPQIDDFRQLFLGDIELLDVRAPVEFEQGAFPRTQNSPLLNDEERHQVGLCYKTKGQDKAVELGYQLVSGELKENRVDVWQAFFEAHPEAVLYCFRGGMRSQITQQWLFEKTGKKYPRVKGGYRALRQFLLQQLQTASETVSCLVLSGRTGVGKTVLLNKIEQKIDLEGLFHHRGSVFGMHVQPQPSQIDVENTLAIALLKLQNQGLNTLVFEDESANIGGRRIPENIFNMMRSAPILLLEAPSDERINIIFDEYITEALDEHHAFYGEDFGFEKWSLYLYTALDKIQRRLGGQAHKELRAIMYDALKEQQSNGHRERHKEWISRLLLDYYDPMYDYQLSKKSHRVIFKGTQNDVLEYISSQKNS